MNIDISFYMGDQPQKPVKEKRNKGMSLIDLPLDYTVIDLETTGLDPEFNEIIELGALRIRNGIIVDSFNTLVKPKELIDDFITELTGITNKMVSSSPKIEEVIFTFVEFIGKDIIVGHNINFDLNFIYDYYKLCSSKEFSNNYIDTLRLARILLKDLDHHRLKDLIKHFNLSKQSIHRAMADTNTTHEIYLILRNIAFEKYVSLEGFITNSKPVKTKVNANDISSNNTEFDVFHTLYNKNCVFTGVLEKMLRKDAMQLVVDCGGKVQNNVNSDTEFLIIGNLEYCSNLKGEKSNKLKRVEKMMLKGKDVKIISENTFYDIFSM